MIRPIRAAWICALLMATCLATQANAQSKSTATRPTGLFGYDVSKEVTLKGTVTSVGLKSEEGTVQRNHLLVATASGNVDANLGRFAFVGKEPLSVEPGQEVELTGVMTTQQGHEVFITRLVKSGSQTYTLRTERGFALSPQSRERMAEQSTQKEVQP
jgi:hypothetical protein